MSRIIVIGGGAAGMMAAAAAAEKGDSVTLLEQNEKLGKKVYITGKGRCNLTNACEPEDFFNAVCSNPKFMYSSFYRLTNRDVMDFFEKNGVPLKVERGGRVFPVSDHASDIIRALSRLLDKRGVKIHLNTKVLSLITEKYEEEGEEGIRVVGVEADRGNFYADHVIVATGGSSYPSTGATGDGYRFARDLGLKVKDPVPSLVPMNVKEKDAVLMQGLSLKNVSITLKDGKKKIFEGFGEMMFTHFGVTGPLILTASAMLPDKSRGKELTLEIDLKPALDDETLDRRFVRCFEENANRQLKNALTTVFPSTLVPVIIARSNISPDKPVRNITKAEREVLTGLTRRFAFTVTSLRGFSEAIITRGGVNVRQIDPSTMKVKGVKGVSFAGEVLDVDAVTGGFNLQIAWSTGYAAGIESE